MPISERKMKIAIENYFKNECDVNTSIHAAFEKGFRIGVRQGQLVSAEPQWILLSERLPEEHEWIGTKKFGTTISDKVYVTFESPKGERFCRHLCFENGKLSPPDQQTIDVWYKGSVPIAWMPFPEPYKGDRNERTA